MSSNFLTACGLVSVFVLGCSGADGASDGARGAGGNAGAAGASSQAGASGIAGSGPDCDPSGSDAPDADGLDENCDGADGQVGRDVYVDPASGSDTNSGTPDAPLRTLAAAVQLAQTRDGNVLVTGGKQEIDEVSFGGSYAIFGGYGSSFSGTRHRETTVLQPTHPEGLLITNADEARFDTLTIRGVSPDEKVSPTAQALRLDVKLATLSNVVVEARNAATGSTLGDVGADGSPGVSANGADGASGLSCGGVTPPNYVNGAKHGQPSSQGDLPGNCLTKTLATPGVPGAPGTPGADASSLPSFDGTWVRWGDGKPGQPNAAPGYGGAGGCDWAGIVGGGAGTGGCPGLPGAGASSGGGSIAVILLGGKLELIGSRIVTGFGGSGGSGAPGGKGGDGGWGGKPGCLGCTDPVPNTCSPPTDPMAVGCAAWGAAGGKGGEGGHGGAGVGGWTIGILAVGSAESAYDSATEFDLGKPGTGGDGGNGRAADGQSKQRYVLAP